MEWFVVHSGVKVDRILNFPLGSNIYKTNSHMNIKYSCRGSISFIQK